MKISTQTLIQMQAALEKIEGVHASKLITNDNEEITECHILANSQRHPKQISKDVQSVLATTFEYRIDHRIISVAQIENSSTAKVLPRIVYKSVEVNKKEQMLSAIVTCKFDDIEYEGKYSGVATKNSEFRIVAEATLEAVRCHTKDNEHIVLEGYSVHDVGGLMVANVVLAFVRGKKEYNFVGTALVNEHIHEAYVKAVFDALNRVLFVE